MQAQTPRARRVRLVRIVLIDDEQRLLYALVTAFRFRWPDADVITATDGESGLWLAVERCTDQVRGLELGADDYLNKPFGNMALLAHVAAVLRRTRGHAESSARAELVVG